ncbi:MAG: glycosyltransferase family 2 protein [Actinomycetota bacterium]|nr:glycosyltransferase family 2 protein [Actinomycetota bacterium]MDI6821550.1 glycosyltransferase family 2 protein [Actinomycetota bacterium]
MKLSVIIPAYNEEQTIKEIIRRVQAVKIDKEIIVVDDGSIDGTTEILKQLRESNSEIKVHFCPKNRGKGAAIKAGLSYVTGNIVLIQDADLELNPEEYHNLIKPIVKGEAKVIYGSRFRKKIDGLSLYTYLGNKIVTLATNLLYRIKLTDQATGYKVFATDVIKSISLECDGFEFCSEVTAKARRLGYDIAEVPISYFPRARQAGKKVRWQDGFKALYTLLKYRFARIKSIKAN